jgi:hypothetical protein
VELEDVVKDVEAVILAIPTTAVPHIAGLLTSPPLAVAVIDAPNYYPFRDGRIADLDEGKVESIWISQQLGRPVIKAFNEALAHTQARRGSRAALAASELIDFLARELRVSDSRLLEVNLVEALAVPGPG